MSRRYSTWQRAWLKGECPHAPESTYPKPGGLALLKKQYLLASHCPVNQKYESRVAILKGRGTACKRRGHTDEQTRARYVRLARSLCPSPASPVSR